MAWENDLYDLPSDIVQQLLIDLGVGVAVTTGSETDWQVYSTAEPDRPDNCITVYNAPGNVDGSDAWGRMFEQYGIQVRIRADQETTAWRRAKLIANRLDTEVSMTSVEVGEVTYQVSSVNRSGNIIGLGVIPGSRRVAYTLNAMMSVRILSVSGTGTT